MKEEPTGGVFVAKLPLDTPSVAKVEFTFVAVSDAVTVQSVYLVKCVTSVTTTTPVPTTTTYGKLR